MSLGRLQLLSGYGPLVLAGFFLRAAAPVTAKPGGRSCPVA